MKRTSVVKIARCVLAPGVLLMLISGCESTQANAQIRYEVNLYPAAATEVEATIHYLLPSGEEATIVATTPWKSPEFSFPAGSTLAVRAVTSEDVAESALFCNLVGGASEGSWSLNTVGSPYHFCDVAYLLGEWPPDDLTGPLVRNG